MNVFLTGGTGFIGNHLLNRLGEGGFPFTCLVRKKNALASTANINLVEGDLETICDRNLAYELINGHDYVIHCAAIRGEMRLPWDVYYKTNVDATCSLLEASQKAGVKRFIYLSSVGVLGTMPGQLPANEETPYNPDGFYHKSKMLAEKLVIESSISGSLNTVVIRPSITYGPKDNGFFLRVAGMASKGFFPLVNGGRNKIHLTYIDGLINAIISALEKSSENREKVYTIVDASPLFFRDLIEIIAASLGKKVKIVNIPSKELFLLGTKIYDTVLGPIMKKPSLTASAKILALQWYYNNKNAQKDLGYMPYDTREQVQNTMHWLISHGLIN